MTMDDVADSKIGHSLRIQLPSWLLKTSWEFQLSRGLGGPSFGLRAWRVVPEDSPAFEAVENGDITALIHLIETGQSTIFDRQSDGETLLHVCVAFYRIAAMINRSQFAARRFSFPVSMPTFITCFGAQLP